MLRKRVSKFIAGDNIVLRTFFSLIMAVAPVFILLGTLVPAVHAQTSAAGGTVRTPFVISGSGATVTLTAAQSGSVALFDRAAGIIYTLPAPAVGLQYDFLVLTSITSGAAKVITDAGTTLLLGSLINIDTDSSNAVAAWTPNGSTHISISMNGTTSGGLVGTWYRATCVDATHWLVTGIDQGSGVVISPFATS